MFWDNKISDISPVAKLTGLEGLTLTQNEISDITPLAELSGLQSLSLDSNRVTDISPLANLPDIVVLSLRFNQITDLEPLVNANISHLDVYKNPLSDLSINGYIPQIVENGATVMWGWENLPNRLSPSDSD